MNMPGLALFLILLWFNCIVLVNASFGDKTLLSFLETPSSRHLRDNHIGMTEAQHEASSHQDATMPHKGNKIRFRGLKSNQEYTTAVELRWEADGIIPRDKAAILAEDAKTFIARNFPISSNTSGGITSVDILDTSVVGQTFYHSANPSFLSVVIKVRGVVVVSTQNSSLPTHLDFEDLVASAIWANDGEFLEKAEPIVSSSVSMMKAPTQLKTHTQTDDTKEKTRNMIVIVVLVSAIFSVIVLLAISRTWGEQTRFGSLEHETKEHPVFDLNETASGLSGSASGHADDSVAEESMYTMRTSPPPYAASYAIPIKRSFDENGGTIFNTIIAWTFSQSRSDDDNDKDEVSCGFDTRSTASIERKPTEAKQEETSRCCTQGMDDISTNDVYEESESNLDAELGPYDAQSNLDAELGPYIPSAGKYGPENTSSSDSVITGHETLLDCSSSAIGRLGIAAMDGPVDDKTVTPEPSMSSTQARAGYGDFDDYDEQIKQLPAPHQYQTRSKERYLL